MVWIEGGKFKMGGTIDAAVSSFCIDRTEVTVAAYKKCVDDDKCQAPKTGGASTWAKHGHENHPVNNVDWEDARIYCDWAKKQLPTEVQWEFAAGSREGRKYPWGSDEPGTRACWNGEGNDLGDGKREGTCEVGKYPSGATKQGVQDMAGNVWEWVQDWYAPLPEAIQDGYVKSWCGDCPGRVERGSCWRLRPDGYMQVTERGLFPPDRGDVDLGFRCAKSK